MSDKRRISATQARHANFNLIRTTEPINDFQAIDFEQITCVVVLPFTHDGNLVTVRLQRGLDIPGGHVQADETSIAQVAHRETWEEAAVTLDELYVTGIIESDYFGSQPEELTYIVVVSAFVREIQPFIPNEEALARLIIPVEEFLQEYRTTNQEMMKQMIDDAKACLRLDLNSSRNTSSLLS
ncbi:NUDIX hydrolase [Calothrix sp. NIES-4101]|nr:NUDIX hydrolase [Calothrix sp. NIES-4101]